MISKEQQQIIIDTLKEFKPRSISVFGSYSRGENNSKSDLDLLVDFEETVNLLDLVGLEMELSEKLKIKVDLITTNAVSKHLKPHIDRDLIKIKY
jgi:hypothetical protein